jgi:hypothetical protein
MDVVGHSITGDYRAMNRRRWEWFNAVSAATQGGRQRQERRQQYPGTATLHLSLRRQPSRQTLRLEGSLSRHRQSFPAYIPQVPRKRCQFSFPGKKKKEGLHPGNNLVLKGKTLGFLLEFSRLMTSCGYHREGGQGSLPIFFRIGASLRQVFKFNTNLTFL